MKKLTITAIVIAALSLFVSLTALLKIDQITKTERLQKEDWTGFYYYDGCLACNDYDVSGPLESQNKCEEWINIKIINNNGGFGDKYECGKNCELKGDIYVCEETFDK